MKKTAVSFVVIFAFSMQIFGQNVDKEIARLSKQENVEKISIGSVGMFFTQLLGVSVGGKDALQGMKGLKSFELLALSDECPAAQKTEIWNRLKNLKDDKEYATLMHIKENDNLVRFLVKEEKKDIREILIIILSVEEKAVVIRLKGNFKPSDLADLVAKSNPKGDGQ
ncbi:MAG: DUF4252 domain-containing protein [Dysgonamonadaceae bacterium]|jgi:hypothetical protein|nr:DUF4252 domain-containing protein [Dysgonamonadaceae bacterium]